MVTLNKPSAGDVDWTTEINANWTTIEDELNSDILAVDDGNTIGNTGSETSVFSHSVTAGTLDADEEMLHFRCRINWRTNNKSLTVRVKFAGSTLFTFSSSPGQSNRGSERWDVYVCRTSSTTGSAECFVFGANNYQYTWQNFTGELPSLVNTNHSEDEYDDDFSVTWADANTFEVTGDFSSATGMDPSLELHHAVLGHLHV